jgi:hypothetical protein
VQERAAGAGEGEGVEGEEWEEWEEWERAWVSSFKCRGKLSTSIVSEGTRGNALLPMASTPPL